MSKSIYPNNLGLNPFPTDDDGNALMSDYQIACIVQQSAQLHIELSSRIARRFVEDSLTKVLLTYDLVFDNDSASDWDLVKRVSIAVGSLIS